MNRLRRLCHLATEAELRVALHPEQARHLAAKRDDFGKHVEIRRRPTVGEFELIAPARVLVIGVGHEREVLGILEPENVIALVVALRLFQIRRRKTAHLFRRERDLGLVLADVALEYLARFLELLDDDLHSRALRTRERDTGVLKAFDQILLQLALDRGRWVNREHAPIQRLALQEVGIELVELQQTSLGRAANRLVGMNVRQQIDGTLDVLDGDLHPVDRVKHGFHRRAFQWYRFEISERLAHVDEALVAYHGNLRCSVKG